MSERTDKDIENIVKENLKSGNLSINRPEDTQDQRNDEEIVKDFVKNIREFLEVNMMYEKE